MNSPRTCPAAAAITRLAPFAHVADVERSLEFYERFGLERGDTLRLPDAGLVWGSMRRGAAHIMFARASGPIDATLQAVLFYLYTQDVRALQTHLMGRGVHHEGRYTGVPRGPLPSGRLFDITFPSYMPGGEMRVEDPDGYVLLIGQLDA